MAATRPLEFETPVRRRLTPSHKPAFDGCVLSRRELQTLRQMARGLTYAEAARERHVSSSTIHSLLHTAYQRLGVSSVAQALAVCIHAGWIDVVPHDGEIVELADRRVTWAQRLYLEAFDQSLRAGNDTPERARTKVLRDAALTGVFREAAKERPWRTTAAEPLERIARTIQRLGTRDGTAGAAARQHGSRLR